MSEIRTMQNVVKSYLESFPIKVGVTSVIALLMLCIYFPKGDEVYFINSFHSSALDWALTNITLLGNGLLLVPLVVYSAFLRFRYTIAITLASAFNGLLCTFFKRGIFADAARPIKVLDQDLLHFVDGVDVHSFHSFPSGHTATAFVIAMLLAILIRVNWATILLFILAILVGYSRIYLLQHFLGDVAAGAAVGIISVSLSYFLCFHRFNKMQWMDQRAQIKIGNAQSGQPIGN